MINTPELIEAPNLHGFLLKTDFHKEDSYLCI